MTLICGSNKNISRNLITCAGNLATRRQIFGVVMIEVDAVAQRHELLGVVLLGDLMNGIKQANDIVGEHFIVLRDLL